MKTYSQKPTDIQRRWYLIDASQAPLGRIATQAASLLLGKGKPTKTAHLDGGDFVVVINAQQLVTTGDKAQKKAYYRHSGFPGGIYKRTLAQQQQQDPTVVLQRAIRGMLPANKLRDGRLRRLKIYAGPEHEHTAQQPRTISVKGKNNGSN
jgi:large subunit ribosomal protein L13